MSSGNSTGIAAKAIYDAEHRPITAGGFVTTGTIVFQDVSKESHVGTFVHTMGTPDKKYIIDADGSGVGLIDYDNDGWLDIYMVNGSTFEALDGKKRLLRTRRCFTTITTAPLPTLPTRRA